MAEPVYKVLRAEEFAEASRRALFEGSADDLRDGFIHLSTGEQLEGTLRKHFAGEDGIVLLALDAAQLGQQLTWEPSRGGALFPHLYAPLPLAAVLWVERLGLGDDGMHRLPAAFARVPV